MDNLSITIGLNIYSFNFDSPTLYEQKDSSTSKIVIIVLNGGYLTTEDSLHDWLYIVE